MRAALLLLFAGCTESVGPDMADALPLDEAAPPSFDLVIASRFPGAATPGSVGHLPPGADVWIAVSRTYAPGAGVCPPAAAGMCSDLGGAVTFVEHVVTNADGWAPFRIRIPNTVPAGIDVYAQALAIDAAGQMVWSDVTSFFTEPLACPDIWAPVCGFGPIEAANSCYLQEGDGRVVDHRGPC